MSCINRVPSVKQVQDSWHYSLENVILALGGFTKEYKHASTVYLYIISDDVYASRVSFDETIADGILLAKLLTTRSVNHSRYETQQRRLARHVIRSTTTAAIFYRRRGLAAYSSGLFKYA